MDINHFDAIIGWKILEDIYQKETQNIYNKALGGNTRLVCLQNISNQ